jgi:GNAT superfamily N-acetyltransferase
VNSSECPTLRPQLPFLSPRGILGLLQIANITAHRVHCLQRRYSLAKRAETFIVIQDPKTVLSYVQQIREGADSEKNALGFVPANAYEEAARKGTIFVAVTEGPESKYVGHILFGDKFPHGRVYQTFVSPSARGRGVGRLLVRTFVEFAERKGYLSLIAKVAKDLDANKFYEALGFETLVVKQGGSSRGRLINVRVKQLNTPALFGYRIRVSGLPLSEPILTFTPVLTIDLNVFFDVVKRRPRSTEGGLVMGASFNNLIRLTVTEEFAEELRRTTAGTTDPVLEFALQLPTLSSPPDGIPTETLELLAQIVFPQRAAQQKLTVQDLSDLKHLAIAAHHKVSAFVTAENALVAASSAIEDTFGLRVVHVKDLAALLENVSGTHSPLDIGFAEGDLRLSESDFSIMPSIERLVSSLNLPADLRALVTASGINAADRKSLLVSLGDEIVAASFWKPHAGLNKTLEVVLISDEDQASNEVAIDALLHRMSHTFATAGPTRFQLTIPNVCLSAQRTVLRYGFMRCADSNDQYSRFQRLAVGAPITFASWPAVRRDLNSVASMSFPIELPQFLGPEMIINFETQDSKEYAISLFDLETTLSPAVMLLPGRDAVLVPIKAVYADDLLGTADQASLFARRQAAVIHERTYFCSHRNQKLFPEGTIVVFYESGKSSGRMAAIAIARVRNAEIVLKRKVSQEVIEKGVLDEQELNEITMGEQVLALTFDNVMKLKHPVPLSKLRELGCVDGSNAITSRNITSSQVQEIVEEGGGIRE